MISLASRKWHCDVFDRSVPCQDLTNGGGGVEYSSCNGQGSSFNTKCCSGPGIKVGQCTFLVQRLHGHGTKADHGFSP